MDNVPVHVNGSVAVGRNASGRSSSPEQQAKQKKNKLKPAIIAAGVVVILGILVFGILFLYQSSTASAIDGSKYQAVFFTNGQVYFGKLQTLNSGYMKLTDVYYLQTQAAATTDQKNPQETSSLKSSDVQLVKLGNEIHGPDDKMIISKDQVLFFENLKKDGKVTATIAKYQSQKQ